jgi:hypothetical protein
LRHLAWISAAILAVVALNGCKPKQQGYVSVKVSTHVEEGNVPRVSFGIAPRGRQTPTHWRYEACYTRQSKTAHFVIDLRPSTATSGAATVRTGTGSFIALSDSDDTLLLSELRQVLKANNRPVSSIRVRELPFRFDIVGENLDRGRNGSLVDAATGNWISVRLYLGVHQDKEVILNFQKPGGTAEFVGSDAQYSNDVLAELAKVL